MNADGSGKLNLTNNGANDWLPALTADGNKVFFVSNRDGAYDIWSMNTDGSGLAKVQLAVGQYSDLYSAVLSQPTTGANFWIIAAR